VKISNYLFATFLSLLTLSCSQGFKQSGRDTGFKNGENCNAATWGWIEEDKNNSRISFRRLESFTWDSVQHQLKWDISKGEKRENGYQPRSRDRYEINMDKATMTVNGESRRFSEDEAANVRTLMDFISKYAVESTVWWESGEGEPVDGPYAPPRPEKRRPTRPEGGKDRATRIVAMHLTGR
jgi:hypothetical protein